MRFIKDLGLKIAGNLGNKERFGLYECPTCLELFERNISYIKSKKPRQCAACNGQEMGHRKTHGMTGEKIYKVWCGIKDRCLMESHISYSRYGGRGIAVCKEWADSFEAFYRDMGDIPEEGMQIDRRDNDGNYEPSNCRWVTCTENNRNKPSTKITENDASLIKTLLLYGGNTAAEIAETFNVRASLIRHIKFNESWKDISPLPV